MSFKKMKPLLPLDCCGLSFTIYLDLCHRLLQALTGGLASGGVLWQIAFS
jgi:hypothetical protein